MKIDLLDGITIGGMLLCGLSIYRLTNNIWWGLLAIGAIAVSVGLFVMIKD
jgi:hypothetical protein